MEKGFKIEIKNKEQVQIEPVNLSVDEFIVLGGAGLELALKTAYNQLEEELTDEEKKDGSHIFTETFGEHLSTMN